MEATIFSQKVIRQKAKEIAMSTDISIELQSPGHVLIKIKCESDRKYKKFRKWVNSNKPLGAKVTFKRR